MGRDLDVYEWRERQVCIDTFGALFVRSVSGNLCLKRADTDGNFPHDRWKTACAMSHKVAAAHRPMRQSGRIKPTDETIPNKAG
jgi:hypothetical protein